MNLHKRVTLHFLSLIFPFTLILFLFFLFKINSLLKNELIARGEVLAKDLAYIAKAAVKTKDAWLLEDALQRIARREGVAYVFVYDPTGEILAVKNSIGASAELEPRIRAKTVKQDIVYANPYNLKNKLGSGNYLDFVYPVWQTDAAPSQERKILGFTRIGLSAATLIAEKRSLLLLGFFVIILMFILGYLVSWFLAHGLTRPIRQLVETTKSIIKGELQKKIKVSSKDEIGVLAAYFNQMTEEIHKSKNRLENYSHELEEKIKEKVEQLNLIYRIGQEVSTTLELTEVLERIVERLTGIIGLRICAILLLDEKEENLLIKASRGLQAKDIQETKIKKGEAVSGWVWDYGQSVLTQDINKDERFSKRQQERYYLGSFISVPLRWGDRIVGVINLNQKKNASAFSEDDLRLLEEIAIECSTAIENAKLYKNLQETYLSTIAALAAIIDAKDHYTRQHSENVTRLAVAIAKEDGLKEEEVDLIRRACQLHDLGKISIHDYILTKPDKLSSSEWEEMKQHPEKAAQILSPLAFMEKVVSYIREHHERYDGKGYPSAKKGEEISLGARIMAVADAFDAMISERPYRHALSIEEAINELKLYSGTQFDPRVVKLLLNVLKTHPELLNEMTK
jgi:putative nucleotidyltransferase with HDIG domain